MSNRMVVEVFDAEGNLVERLVGKSEDELHNDHLSMVCAPTCSWCHQELADKIGEDAALANMYQRCFGTEMPTNPQL